MKDNATHTKLTNPNIHRFVKALPPRHEPDEQEALESFQEARAQSRESVMLDIRFADGRKASLPYSSLLLADYLPDGTLLLDFGKYEVRAVGRNMQRVRELIIEHRARFIQEGVDIECGANDTDAVHFERIEITKAEEL